MRNRPQQNFRKLFSTYCISEIRLQAQTNSKSLFWCTRALENLQNKEKIYENNFRMEVMFSYLTIDIGLCGFSGGEIGY